MTPYHKLCAAISIIQDRILAEDSTLNPDKVFPEGRFTTGSLEVAVGLMSEILDVVVKVEDVSDDATTAQIRNAQ